MRYFDGPFCRKQRKLAKIWRAIARRRLHEFAYIIAHEEMHALYGYIDQLERK